MVNRNRAIRKVTPFILSLLLVGCGQESFDTQYIQREINPNTIITVPPKVDIVVFQDVSASMKVPLNKVKAQVQSFLSTLDRNWDFRFIVLPLQFQDSELALKYVIARDCETVLSNRCLTTDEANLYDREDGYYDVDNNIGLGGDDRGFKNIREALPKLKSSQFIRSDALLVVIPLTNGNDTTDVPLEDRGDGSLFPNFNAPKAIRSLNNFYSFLTTIKDVDKLSFYSITAKRQTQNCHGRFADTGSRYNEIAQKINDANLNATNGKVYDICSNSEIGSVLSDIAAQMVNSTRNIHFNFIAIPRKPDPSTLKIYKNGTLIPRGGSNGWSLVLDRAGEHAYQENKATSYNPVGHKKSGYFIEFSGNAHYTGQDSIGVEYEPLL